MPHNETPRGKEEGMEKGKAGKSRTNRGRGKRVPWSPVEIGDRTALDQAQVFVNVATILLQRHLPVVQSPPHVAALGLDVLLPGGEDGLFRCRHHVPLLYGVMAMPLVHDAAERCVHSLDSLAVGYPVPDGAACMPVSAGKTLPPRRDAPRSRSRRLAASRGRQRVWMQPRRNGRQGREPRLPLPPPAILANLSNFVAKSSVPRASRLADPCLPAKKLDQEPGTVGFSHKTKTVFCMRERRCTE